MTPTDENEPISREELPADQQEFLKNYEELVSMLPWDVRSEEYHHFNDVLSKMLSQANLWGQEKGNTDG